MNKQTVSHFQILEPLGAGGMGQVYRALDTNLKRTVALKFVSSDLLNEPKARSRLLREARSAATLNHPNICTIHEIGESEEGQSYIAMACYEGVSLHSKIKDEKFGASKSQEGRMYQRR